MGQIGDYIHYKASNYNKYGITQRKNKVDYNYEIQRKKIKNKINGLMTFKDKEGLQNTLNRFFSSEDRSEKDQLLVDNVIKEMENLFGSTLGRINMDTGNIDGNQLQKASSSNEKAIRKSINDSDTYISTIYSRLNIIETALKNITDSKKYTEINSQINKIYAVLKQIVNDGRKNKILIPELRGRTFDHVLLKMSTIDKYKNEKGENIITMLNNLIKNADLFSIASSLQKGTLFEYLIAAAPAAARLEAGEEIDKVMEDVRKSVQGGERSKVVIDFDKNNFTNEINVNKLGKQINGYSGSNRMLVSYGYSQHKLDVSVEWGGQAVPISAKNVNLGGKYTDIHIVSGTSLLYLLQDEDADFVNNYFNIIAEHPDGIIQNSKAAHEAAKITILFKALTGKTFGREAGSAEVFIVNDNKTGTVKVVDMKDLLNKAYDNVDMYANITANKIPLERIKVANRWADTYGDRITDFIMHVHQQKISASLKSSILS